MNVQPYAELLRRPGVARLLGFAIFGRLPRAATSVVITLHVVLGLHRGYGAAGVMLAAFTVGNALGAPWRGRAVDRAGLRRALVLSLVAEVAFWGTAPFLGYEVLLVTFTVYGVLSVPVFGIVRQSLGAIVPPENQRPAFALDSMSLEVTFMLGPAAGVLIATLASPMTALVTLGVTSVAAGVGLFALDPATRSGRPEPHEPHEPHEPRGRAGARWHPPWLTAPLLLVLVTTLGAVVVLGGCDVAIVASLREQDALGLATLVFIAWSMSSLVGGLVFGAMHRPVSPALLLLVMGVCTAPIGLAPGPLWLALAIVPAGALCAPVLSSTAAAVTSLSPERVRGEVMGWYGSALTTGGALGAPLAGRAADLLGGWGGFAAVGTAGAAVGAAVLAVEARHRATRRQISAPATEETEEMAPEARSVPVAGSDPAEWSARYQD